MHVHVRMCECMCVCCACVCLCARTCVCVCACVCVCVFGGWGGILLHHVRPCSSMLTFTPLCLQILLNFFVAVILDNLDYDEKKKKTKLEEELQKSKVEKVPYHLKLVTRLGGAKRVPVPKLSSATGIEPPVLTQAEVKSFYDTGEALEFPVTSALSESHPISHQHVEAPHRLSSDLSNLSLLSGYSSDVLSSGNCLSVIYSSSLWD